MLEPTLTPALEDYLETIYRLMAGTGYARVRDIAAARDVQPGSVSPAMKRLDALGLVEYERRESVRLTERGLQLARRVDSRHRVLQRFFESFLRLPADVAEHDACAAEHALSSLTVDRLVRLFEYMEMCPQGEDQLQRFLSCSLVFDDVEPCGHECPGELLDVVDPGAAVVLGQLVPGQTARVRQIDGGGELRPQLLDMGLLPHTELQVVSTGGDDDGQVVVQVRGYELTLSAEQARAVKVALS